MLYLQRILEVLLCLGAPFILWVFSGQNGFGGTAGGWHALVRYSQLAGWGGGGWFLVLNVSLTAASLLLYSVP